MVVNGCYSYIQNNRRVLKKKHIEQSANFNLWGIISGNTVTVLHSHAVDPMRWHITKERKEIAVHMSLEEDVRDKDIRCLTGICEQTMQCIWQTDCETGEVVRTPVCQGWPRLLDSLEADVSYTCISSILTFIKFISFLKVVSSGNLTCFCRNYKTTSGKFVVSRPPL